MRRTQRRQSSKGRSTVRRTKSIGSSTSRSGVRRTERNTMHTIEGFMRARRRSVKLRSMLLLVLMGRTRE